MTTSKQICPFTNPTKCDTTCLAYYRSGKPNQCMVLGYLFGIREEISKLSSKVNNLRPPQNLK